MLQNIGITEFVLIAVAALVLFGPDKLPGIGRKLGETVRQLRSAAASFMEDVTQPPEHGRTIQKTEAEPAQVEDAAASAGIHKSSASSAVNASEGAPAASEVSPTASAKNRRAPDPRRLPE